MSRVYLAAVSLSVAMAVPVIAQIPSLTAKQQEELTRELKGTVQTEKVDCIRRSSRLKLRVISDDLLLYRVGSKRYVARTIGTCRGMSSGVTPVIHSDATRICAGDNIFMEDLSSGVDTGSCRMGGFAVYDSPEK